jgi:hypothetical protein
MSVSKYIQRAPLASCEWSPQDALLRVVDYEVDPYEDALCNVAPPKGSDDAFFQNDCKCASSNVSMDKVRFITPSSISSFIDCVSCRFENVQYCVSKFYSLYVAFH